MSYDPMPFSEGPSRAAERTSTPGLLIIIIGAINILWALFIIGNYAFSVVAPEQGVKTAEDLAKMFPSLPQEKTTPEEVQRNALIGVGFGVVALAGSFLTLFGGMRMRQLRSYGLAMIGAIVAAVPCISCLGCCGAGEIIGIWAIVVLMNEEVKRAFT